MYSYAHAHAHVYSWTHIRSDECLIRPFRGLPLCAYVVFSRSTHMGACA